MPSAFGVVTYRELEFPNYLCIGNGSKVIRSNNIHVDNRVVRGNTFASIVLTANQKRNKEAKERESATTRLSLTKVCSAQLLLYAGLSVSLCVLLIFFFLVFEMYILLMMT